MTKDDLVTVLRKQGYGRIADMLDAEVDAGRSAAEVYEAVLLKQQNDAATPKKKAK